MRFLLAFAAVAAAMSETIVRTAQTPSKLGIAPPGRFEIRVSGRSFTPPEATPQWSSLFADAGAPRAQASSCASR